MTIALLSYQTSVLNPLLKLAVLVLFAVSFWYFWRCRKMYGGILHRVATLVLIGSAAGMLASAFRYEGDLYTQFKWGESIMDLILALITLGIALLIRRRLIDASQIFSSVDKVQEYDRSL